MYNSDKSMREDRLRRNPRNPSFSSSLLDEIYRRIDGGEEKCEELKLYKEKIAKKHGNGGGGGLKAKTNSIEEKDTGSLRRACLVEKWMEKKVNEKVSARRRQSLPKLERKSEHDNDPLFFSSSSSSSDSSFGGFSSSETESLGPAKSKTSCFATQRLKPVRTSVSAQVLQPQPAKAFQSEFYMFDDYDHHREDLKNNDEGFIKLKLRALKIYNNLKKVKQPISPGGRVASFLNSLFIHGSAKKTKNLSSIGGNEDASSERKSKCSHASTCSSASSFSRSCLSKTSQNSRDKSNIDGVKRTVRFYPFSVIVDEDCRPCGQKCIYQDERERLPEQLKSNEQVSRLHFMEKNRKRDETARDLLQSYSNQKRNEIMVRNEDEDDDDEAASDSSSDLFELDHLALMGNNRYCQELPVYETTHLGTKSNRVIANGLFG